MKTAEIKSLNADIKATHDKLKQIKTAISRLSNEPEHDEEALSQLHDIEIERQELLADAELTSDSKERAAIEKQLEDLASKAATLKQQAKAPAKKIAERRSALEARQESVAAELEALKHQQLGVMPEALEPARAKQHSELVKAAWALIDALGKHEAYVNEKTRLSTGQYFFQSVSNKELLSGLARITQSAPDAVGHDRYTGELEGAYRRAENAEKEAIKEQWNLL